MYDCTTRSTASADRTVTAAVGGSVWRLVVVWLRFRRRGGGVGSRWWRQQGGTVEGVTVDARSLHRRSVDSSVVGAAGRTHDRTTTVRAGVGGVCRGWGLVARCCRRGVVVVSRHCFIKYNGRRGLSISRAVAPSSCVRRSFRRGDPHLHYTIIIIF